MNQTGTNRYRQERDFLLYVAQSHPTREIPKPISRRLQHYVQLCCCLYPCSCQQDPIPSRQRPMPIPFGDTACNEGGYGKMQWEDNTDRRVTSRRMPEIQACFHQSGKHVISAGHANSSPVSYDAAASSPPTSMPEPCPRTRPQEDKQARFAEEVHPRLPINRFYPESMTLSSKTE